MRAALCFLLWTLYLLLAASEVKLNRDGAVLVLVRGFVTLLCGCLKNSYNLMEESFDFECDFCVNTIAQLL